MAVSAPAGYGKTTFLIEWARTEDRPVAWVSLDRSDDDPIAFLGTLAAALIGTGLAGDLQLAELSGPGASAIGRVAPRVAAALASTPSPFVMMLDDLQVIDDPACHGVLDLLLSAIPAGSQVVCASRAEQPHVPLLRSRGEVFEIGPRDLVFDDIGAQRIFGAAGIDLSPELAAPLVERTEGWAAGIYLTALVAKENPAAMLDISGRDPFVADYLHHEAFSRLDPDDQSFLLRTSVLEQFSAESCDAVTESTGSAARLRRLEASNLFLVPLDRQRHWYRYHALYREFLLAQLRQLDPGRVASLHHLAARWFESAGPPEFAVDHLLQVGDLDGAVAVVGKFFRPIFTSGRESTARRWLAELGDDRVASHPPLTLATSWFGALTGDAESALRWADVADRVDLGVGLQADQFSSARAVLRAALCRRGVDEMLADAAFAVSHEPPTGEWRTMALWLHGEAHLLADDIERASSCFDEVVAAPLRHGQPGAFAVSLNQLAWLAMDRNDWSSADALIERALDIVEHSNLQDYILAMLVHASSARLWLHRADPRAAAHELDLAVRGRHIATHALPVVAVQLRLRSATIACALGDPQTARLLLREIDEITRRRPGLGALVDEIPALRHLVASVDDRAGNVALTAAELRLLPYLQTHLTFREIGEALFVSRNTVNSQAGSIYRKFGVTNRGDAVRQAMAVDLLGQ